LDGGTMPNSTVNVDFMIVDLPELLALSPGPRFFLFTVVLGQRSDRKCSQMCPRQQNKVHISGYG